MVDWWLTVRRNHEKTIRKLFQMVPRSGLSGWATITIEIVSFLMFWPICFN